MSEDIFKGGVHAAMATTVGAMLAYNLMRWCSTQHRRNAVNVAVYVPWLVYEWRQARYHWRQT